MSKIGNKITCDSCENEFINNCDFADRLYCNDCETRIENNEGCKKCNYYIESISIDSQYINRCFHPKHLLRGEKCPLHGPIGGDCMKINKDCNCPLFEKK